MSDRVINLIPTLLKFVQVNEFGCWIWSGARDSRGYGRVSAEGKKSRLAHKHLYEVLMGPVEQGFELDHTCRVPSCTNPRHLEPVTHLENVRRGDAGKVNAERQRSLTHCRHGHPFTPENTYVDSRGCRNCRTCRRLATRAKRAAA